jgi:hypothetical protein
MVRRADDFFFRCKAMPKKVAVIDSVFSIDGIGTVICLPKEDQWSIPADEKIQRRERIQIRTPSGRSIQTFINSIEMVNRGREHGSIAFSLPKHIAQGDVPVGSELWLERDGIDPVLEP